MEDTQIACFVQFARSDEEMHQRKRVSHMELKKRVYPIIFTKNNFFRVSVPFAKNQVIGCLFHNLRMGRLKNKEKTAVTITLAYYGNCWGK